MHHPVHGPDHPRSRGVYEKSYTSVYDRLGSSPLARGLLIDPRHRQSHGGIIPARAGFTARVAARPSTTWGSSPLARGLRLLDGRPGGRRRDHPRSRGVYEMIMNEKYKASGSSPLARGLRSRSTPPPRGIGIIPARAGFTLGRVGGPQEPMDHPRSRGVYREGLLVQPQRGGSSPLARGLPAALNAEGYAVRIIPARAGFTPRRGPARRRRGDHPRSRGVYPGEAEPPHGVDGSSPLARGLPLRALVLAAYGGIIPARAGFTTARPSTRRPSGDHPRSRGVYLWSRDEYDVARGSSPLARGLPMSRWRKESSSGIIPARAGFTVSGDAPFKAGADHPRSRGVYSR